MKGKRILTDENAINGDRNRKNEDDIQCFLIANRSLQLQSQYFLC